MEATARHPESFVGSALVGWAAGLARAVFDRTPGRHPYAAAAEQPATDSALAPLVVHLRQELLRERAAHRALAETFQREKRLAARMQREFVPRDLPRLGRVSFSAVYRPAEYVSGDIYSVQRLDEERVAIVMADACGHGLAAAMLTGFVKRALDAGRDDSAQAGPGGGRIFEPAEVLRRLNADLVGLDFAECRFVAVTYAVLNLRTLELRVARGGTPYPVHRTAAGNMRLIRSEGCVLGGSADADFRTEAVQLQRGDTFVLYSDGVEDLALHATPVPTSGKAIAGNAGGPVVAADESIRLTGWFEALRDGGCTAADEHLRDLCDTAAVHHPNRDDVTSLAIHID